MATAIGVNDTRDPRVVLRDSSIDRQPKPSGASTPIPGPEDVVARECALLWLMAPILMILIALHERDVSSNAPSDGPSYSAHLHHDGTQSKAQDRWEDEGQGTVADRQSEAPPEDVSGDGHVGEDVHSTIQPPRSRGEWSRAGKSLAHIEPR